MYAQINYSAKIGNCNLTIAQVGCFLTSFCDLEVRYGHPIDPPALNNFFRNNNVYVNGCDLFWNAIERYDSSVKTVSTGTGAPPNNDSIVEFIYNNGQSTHFCLVNNVANHTVVDSWDGQIRNWDFYGGPKSWASYSNKGASSQGEDMVDDNFINQQYIAWLGRPAKEEDLKAWRGQTCKELTNKLAGSPERDSLIRFKIQKLYQAALQRAARDDEFAVWFNSPDMELFKGIVDSDEAKRVTAKYNGGGQGVKPYDGPALFVKQ